ncbi:hypothetical protein P4O66_018040 [Electrophorus voltai]|uniref:Rab-GAP TBC domain-containing protein n=1 Tax=Electrophorus voltai TaxID=2609070 RepID=A0AAD8YT19_9TELE|nr:hypothetical protein P4O66_018040 [Electrophorus voltai]
MNGLFSSEKSSNIDCNSHSHDVFISRVAPVKSPATSSQHVKLPGVMDDEGRVDESRLRMYIFKNGGLSPAERGPVWRFLFGMYPCSSTALERPLLLEQMAVRYHVMKRRWQRLLPGAVCLYLNGTDAELEAAVQYFEKRQETEKRKQQHQSEELREMLSFLELQAHVLFERVTFDLEELQEAIRIIDKDIPRTDRDVAYYMHEGLGNLLVLRDILITYAAFHPELEAALLKELDPLLHSHLVTESMDRLMFCHRWLLLGFQREFEHSDALRLLEILSCDHLELISQQLGRALSQERLASTRSLEDEAVMEPQAITTEFTFDLFICATVLLENREALLSCKNEVQLIKFTNSLELKLVYVCSLKGTVDLNHSLKKAEEHFYNYCKRLAWACVDSRAQNHKSKHEHFLYQLRSLF